ncbi:hypothetical protein N7448_006363 [Penicillium atrosanguineum]|nr:hypothetical protein N7448_006363 [Penicillium atrosanguineum]
MFSIGLGAIDFGAIDSSSVDMSSIIQNIFDSGSVGAGTFVGIRLKMGDLITREDFEGKQKRVIGKTLEVDEGAGPLVEVYCYCILCMWPSLSVA